MLMIWARFLALGVCSFGLVFFGLGLFMAWMVLGLGCLPGTDAETGTASIGPA